MADLWGSVSTNVYAKFRCAPLRTNKALGIFRELITTTRRTTTKVAFWDPPSGSNNQGVHPPKDQDADSTPCLVG